MLRSLKEIERYKVSAFDGEIGSVVKFLIDDERWAVRYLVIQTGGPLFLDGKQVLISPISFGELDWKTKLFHLSLTTEKVKNSPSIDVEKPVSRQHERQFSSYYGYPRYWGSPGVWGLVAYPALLATSEKSTSATEVDSSTDVHLRSDEEVRGYHVEGTDGSIGHIEDFIVDDETWEIRYLVVNTRNWWFGKSVLVAPQWVERISWAENKVYIELAREVIKAGPEWSATDAVNRQYETRLYDYYGRPAYWQTAPADPVHSPAKDLSNQ
ncbi:MAG: PRC-barrel domain-containing protein [Deltaproteobacteria bacterium]|nr:PRC-barrel domain-containing protein [Deltaproteobacteria bacterium]